MILQSNQSENKKKKALALSEHNVLTSVLFLITAFLRQAYFRPRHFSRCVAVLTCNTQLNFLRMLMPSVHCHAFIKRMGLNYKLHVEAHLRGRMSGHVLHDVSKLRRYE